MLVSAEDRLKDKLAVAARDKLVQVAKENQLKAERKKKAAKFLQMLKSSGPKVEDETSNQSEWLADPGLNFNIKPYSKWQLLAEHF